MIYFFQRPAFRIKVNPELKKSIEIDQSLKKDVPDTNHHVRVLLLGTGESGKSTVVKQMKVRHLLTYLQVGTLLINMGVYTENAIRNIRKYFI